jgi:hypothetical protein
LIAVERDKSIGRSQAITLLFAGTMVTSVMINGCYYDELQPPPPGNSRIVQARQLRDGDDQDNNTYVPGFGYYHSAFHAWYPYPFNWYYPDYGYYYGGGWNDAPFKGPVPPRSRPSGESLAEVHQFVRNGAKPAAWHNGSFGSTFSRFARGISRGGFGSGFHGMHS